MTLSSVINILSLLGLCQVLLYSITENENVQKFVAIYTAALIKVQEAVNTIKEELIDNVFVQEIMAKLTSVKEMTQAQIEAVKAKVKEYVNAHDLAALITGEVGGSLYNMSDEELTAYFEGIQEKVGEFVESLKIELPELKPIDKEALKERISAIFADMIDKTIGNELYEAIVNLKVAFENRVQYQKDTLKDKVAAKVREAYDKLSEPTKEKVEAFVQQYVVAAYDKIKADYEAQVQKIQELKEKITAVYNMTFGDYKALLDQAMDTAAEKTLEAFNALDAELNKLGLNFTDDVKAQAEEFIANKTAENKEKIAAFFEKIAPDLDITPAQAVKNRILEKCNAILEKANFVYYKVKDAYDKIDWEGLKMYAYISDCVQNDTWGFDMLRTADGENFEFVTVDGFGDKYNYGGRCMVATEYGLYLGTANPFYGAQLFRINDPEAFSSDAYLESNTITLGEDAVVKMGSVGGTGDYRYSVSYKKETSSTWTVAAKNTTENTVTFKPASAVTYDVLITAKDSDGTVIKTKTKLKVNTELENRSVLGAESIALGEKVKVRCKAVGGDGDYQYAVSYKKSSSENWHTLRDYDENNVIVMKPGSATNYDIKVTVKDGTGLEVDTVLSLTVTKPE